MLGLNKVIVSGYLTHAPKRLNTKGDKVGVLLNLAINKSYTKDGEKCTDTTFVSITVWGALAKTCEQYLVKGSPVEIEGRLQSRSWEEDGKRNYALNVVGHNIHFAGRAKGSDSENDQRSSSKKAETTEEAPADTGAAITSDEGDFSDVPF